MLAFIEAWPIPWLILLAVPSAAVAGALDRLGLTRSAWFAGSAMALASSYGAYIYAVNTAPGDVSESRNWAGVIILQWTAFCIGCTWGLLFYLRRRRIRKSRARNSPERSRD